MSFIAVVTAGAVDPEAAQYAEESLRSAFGLPTVRLDPLPEPEYSFDLARGQYSSTLILHDALGRRPAAALRLVVLTERDIFIPMLSFVYGQAQLDGSAAVLSFARLRQEFHGLPPNRALFLTRVKKEVLHEVGHTFGLIHCGDALCSMALSTGLQQLDTKRGEFCEGCSLLLHESLARRGVLSEPAEVTRS